MHAHIHSHFFFLLINNPTGNKLEENGKYYATIIHVDSNYSLIIHTFLIFCSVLLLTGVRGSTWCNSDALSVYSRNQTQTYSRRWSNVSQGTNPLAFTTDYAGRQLSLLTLTVTVNVILPSQRTWSQSAVAGCHRGFWRDVCSSFKKQQNAWLAAPRPCHQSPLAVQVCLALPRHGACNAECTKLQLDVWLKKLSGADVLWDILREGHLDWNKGHFKCKYTQYSIGALCS